MECNVVSSKHIDFFCFRWLCNQNIDSRTRKWAIEGMAYLTLDADVKDDFVQDEPAMQAMFDLSQVHNLNRLKFHLP